MKYYHCIAHSLALVMSYMVSSNTTVTRWTNQVYIFIYEKRLNKILKLVPKMFTIRLYFVSRHHVILYLEHFYVKGVACINEPDSVAQLDSTEQLSATFILSLVWFSSPQLSCFSLAALNEHLFWLYFSCFRWKSSKTVGGNQNWAKTECTLVLLPLTDQKH